MNTVRNSESPDHLTHVLVKNYPSSLSAKEHVDHKGPLSFFVMREHLMDLDFEAIEVRASEARQNRDARRSRRTTNKNIVQLVRLPQAPRNPRIHHKPDNY